MKIKAIIFIAISAIVFWVACSKSPATSPANVTKTTSTGPVAIPSPLPNTVDKTDTLKVMAYNILTYGDDCQGTTTTLNGYFRTIIQFVQPDLMSCEKINEFPVNSGLPQNLAENITDSVLNADYPGRYAYAATTDLSGGSDMSVLFYNKQKLTYVKPKPWVNT